MRYRGFLFTSNINLHLLFPHGHVTMNLIMGMFPIQMRKE